MKLEIVELFESASSDGYNSSGDGNFFIDRYLAEAFARSKYGNSSDVIDYWAAKESEESYYILDYMSPKPPKSVKIHNSESAKNKIKQEALSKLTKEEKEILGL